MPALRRLPAVLLFAATLGTLAALPVAAAVAKATVRVRLTPACYQSGERGLLSGRGFTPSASWTVKLGGRHALGSGHVDTRGQIHARFTAPTYHGTAGIRTLALSVTDGPHVARTSFRMTPLTATFTPRTGPPATLRVRWRVLGLTPDHGVYVHYLAPDGKLRTTLRIGTASMPCGTLKTGPIALFPFAYTFGRWTFQIDASRHFSLATLPRLLIRFDIAKPPGGGQQTPPPGD
jgi:hypothetical protein